MPGTTQAGELSAGPPSVRRGRWYIHLLLIGCYPVVLGLLSWNRSAGGLPALTRTAEGLLATCALQLAIFVAVLALGFIASRPSKEDLFLKWPGGLWPVPLGIAYSLALRLTLGVVTIAIFVFLLLSKVVTPQDLQEFTTANRPDVSAMVDVAALKQNPVYYWLTLTLVSFVVAGLREELWRAAVLGAFCKLWPRYFGSRAGQLTAITIIALAFGIGHTAMGLLAVAGAVFLGIGLGAIMVLHRSLWPAAIAHGMFDATTFALLPMLLDKLPHAYR